MTRPTREEMIKLGQKKLKFYGCIAGSYIYRELADVLQKKGINFMRSYNDNHIFIVNPRPDVAGRVERTVIFTPEQWVAPETYDVDIRNALAKRYAKQIAQSLIDEVPEEDIYDLMNVDIEHEVFFHGVSAKYEHGVFILTVYTSNIQRSSK